MNASIAVCLVVLSTASAFALRAQGPGDRLPRVERGDERGAVRGSWACTSAVVDGKQLAEKVVGELRLTITEDRYKTERGDEVLFDSTYRIDASKEPKEIDMTATEGEAIGKPALGIYAVNGDTLRLCYVMPGGVRPKAFESAPGSKAFLVTWKKKVGSK